MNIQAFSETLNQIDSQFANEGIPVTERKSKACDLIATKFKWKLNLGDLLFYNTPDSFLAL